MIRLFLGHEMVLAKENIMIMVFVGMLVKNNEISSSLT